LGCGFYTYLSMSYASAIDQLNAMVPELYTRSGQPRRKFSLAEIRILLAALGDPQLRFPALLIAGTNGKGSTAATLASILTASGLRAGLYTSPHLARVNERIRLDRVEIADDAFAGLYFRVHGAARQLVLDGRLPQLPSFFEILTAQALLYFAEAGAQIAVLEVGMGGRLDATNAVDPLLSIITDISLDHTEWLGSTIAAITREKAGILRPCRALIALPQGPEVDQVLAEVAAGLGVRTVGAAAYMPVFDSGSWRGHRGRFPAFRRTPASQPRAGDCRCGRVSWQARLSRHAGGYSNRNSRDPLAGPHRAHSQRRWRRMDSRCGAQSRRSLGVACGAQGRFGWSSAPDAHLQLPARQAGR
jgi:hypothetical protein